MTLFVIRNPEGLFVDRDGNYGPLSRITQLYEEQDLGSLVALEAVPISLGRVQSQIAKPVEQAKSLTDLLEEYHNGTFTPSHWRWRADYSAERLRDDVNKVTYLNLYVMGSGAEQCLCVSRWQHDKMPFETLQTWVQENFGVQVNPGVG